MTTVHTNALVNAYLRRLEQAAAPLGRSRRAELVAEIREHIDDALLADGAAGEAAVRNVLERLGAPEEIVAAAGTRATGPTGRAGKLEVAALIALAVPAVGWLVGIPLVLVSRAWSGSEKAIGALLALLIPIVFGFLVYGAGADSGATVPVGTPEEPASDGLGPLEVAALASVFLSGLVGSAYLALRLRRAGEPQVLEA